MSRTNFLFLFLFLCPFGCQQNSSTSSTTNDSKDEIFVPEPLTGKEYEVLVAKVYALKNNSEKRQFLLSIYTKDQQSRKSSTAAQMKFGYDSSEHNAAEKIIRDTDRRNLIQIEAYFEKFGHPKKEDVGESAAGAPCTIIHHANGKEVRYRNFPYLYKAYQNEDLEGGKFAFYLNRLYMMEFRKRLEIKNPFREKNEIEKLIEELKL